MTQGTRCCHGLARLMLRAGNNNFLSALVKLQPFRVTHGTAAEPSQVVT